MGIKELRSAYGPKQRATTVLNRAVRSEIPGGDRLFQIVNRLYEEKSPLFAELNAVLEEMRAAIAKKYGLKSTKEMDDED